MTKRRHETPEFAKFGDPLASGAAVYMIRGGDASHMVRFYEQVALDTIPRPPDASEPEWQAAIGWFARTKVDTYLAEMRGNGVPASIQRLFEAEGKRRKERCAKELVVTGNDLANLIFNCADIDHTYERKVIEFTPDHLETTDEEREAACELGQGVASEQAAAKHRSKIRQRFKERKCLVAHLFVSKPQWHCFYFSFNDIVADPKKNHWKYGSHVHYISHDWPKWTPETVWAELEKRKVAIKGSLHVRFER